LEGKLELNSNNELFQLYKDFFIFQGRNPDEADSFASKMATLFSTVGSHNIVTLSMNLDDGIGDYVSQVYFIEKFKKLTHHLPNVNLKNISFVSDQKLQTARFVRENKISEESVYILKQNNNDESMSSYANIIGIPTSETQQNNLANIIYNADFLFNIALGLGVDQNSKLIPGLGYSFCPCYFEIDVQNLKKNLFIESWKQYSFENLFASIKISQSDPSYEGPVFSETPMGLSSNQKGIRFIDNISFAAKEDKSDLIDSFSSKILNDLSSLKENQTLADYALNNSFAVGYLQDISATALFVILACELSPKKGDMNILINLSYFNSIKGEQSFIENIVALGFTQIQLSGSNDTIQLANCENKKRRILRLFDFKGISDMDKGCFYGLAEMIAASGDTSFSELISAGLTHLIDSTALPFIQPYLTGASPTVSIINELPYELVLISDLPNPKKINVEYCDTFLICEFWDGKLEAIQYKELNKNFPANESKLLEFKRDAINSLLEALIKKDRKYQTLELIDIGFSNTYMEFGKIFIEARNEGLRYKVYAPDYSSIDDTIPWSDLPEDFPKSNSKIIESKNKYLAILLKITSNRGHTKEREFFEETTRERFSELKEYLQFLDSHMAKRGQNLVINKFNQKEMVKFKENRQEIVHSWNEFCLFLNKKRNEKNHFNELFVRYTFHHLLKNDCIDECIELARLLKFNAFKSESILHLALKLNKKEAIQKIIDTNLSDINQAHSFNNYSPLALAVHYNVPEIVQLLIQNGVDQAWVDTNDLTALELAKKRGYLKISAFLEGDLPKEKSEKSESLIELGFFHPESNHLDKVNAAEQCILRAGQASPK
jgi:hypothetical protein